MSDESIDDPLFGGLPTAFSTQAGAAGCRLPDARPDDVARLRRELGKARRKIEALERAVHRQVAAQIEREQRLVNVRAQLIEEWRRANAKLLADQASGGASATVSPERRPARSLIERRGAGVQPSAAASSQPQAVPASDETMTRALREIEQLDRMLRDLQFKRARTIIREAEDAGPPTPDKARRNAAEADIIRASGLFDEVRYRKKVPSAVDAVARYVEGGLDEDANPHPVFAHRWYVVRYAKMLAGWETPFAHFLAVGWTKGCDPHPLFKTRWYLAQNEDVKRSGVNPFVHFMARGHRESRNPNPVFDTAWYRETYLDDDKPDANPLTHYVFSGKRGDYEPSPLFDTKLLASLHPRVGLPETNALAYLLGLDQGEIDQVLERMRAAKP